MHKPVLCMLVQRHHIYYAYFWSITRNLLQTMLEHGFSNTCIFLILHLSAFLLLGTLDSTLAWCLQCHFKQWNHQQRAQKLKKMSHQRHHKKNIHLQFKGWSKEPERQRDRDRENSAGRCPSRDWEFSPLCIAKSTDFSVTHKFEGVVMLSCVYSLQIYGL